MPLLCLLLLNLVLCVFVAAVVWCAVDVGGHDGLLLLLFVW